MSIFVGKDRHVSDVEASQQEISNFFGDEETDDDEEANKGRLSKKDKKENKEDAIWKILLNPSTKFQQTAAQSNDRNYKNDSKGGSQFHNSQVANNFW